MKNKSITFVAFLQGTNLLVLVCVAVFIATITAINAANIGYLSDGRYATKPVIVPCRTEKGSLSLFKYFNFSFMQGTMKNQGSVNNSTAALTSTGTTSVELSDLFPVEFIEFTRQLKAIHDWINAYSERRKSLDDVIFLHVNKLSDCMSEAAYHIGELVSVEFKEVLYYQVES